MRKVWPPVPSVHHGSERIRVTVHGRRLEFTLGPPGSEQARAEYLRVLAELESNKGRPIPRNVAGITVQEVVAAYLLHLEESESRELYRAKKALAPVLELYGPKRASEFGPLALKAVRQKFVDQDLARQYCNVQASRIRACWSWAVEQELVPSAYLEGLKAVKALTRKKSKGMREARKIRAVPLDQVELVIPFLSQVVADMVRLQLATGARPGEVCALRPADIDYQFQKVGKVQLWLAQLRDSKGSWRGHDRDIVINPQAQKILQPYLDRDPEAFFFSPAEAVAQWQAEKRKNRKTPVQPSQVDRRKKNPGRKPGLHYTTASYDRAITSAIERAQAAGVNVKDWAPNQLRHRVGTEVQKISNRDGARCVLGQHSPQATARYADDIEKACEIMARIGR